MMWTDPRAGSLGDRQGDGTAGPATTGGLVTVPDPSGKAEEFAAEAVKYLGQGGGAETAAVWAALAQVYATLAVAAAIEAAAVSRGRPEIPGPGAVPPVLPEPPPRGVDPLLGF
jgi:ABC-type branched-subunit amino acid transport system substrate-binding protein